MEAAGRAAISARVLSLAHLLPYSDAGRCGSARPRHGNDGQGPSSPAAISRTGSGMGRSCRWRRAGTIGGIELSTITPRKVHHETTRYGLLLVGLCLARFAMGNPAGAEVVLQPLDVPAKRGPNLIPNPGFEQREADRPDGWESQLAPAEIDAASPHEGKACIRFTKPDAGGGLWLTRTVEINQTQPRPLVISGWSKAGGGRQARRRLLPLGRSAIHRRHVALGQKAFFDGGAMTGSMSSFPLSSPSR